MKLHLIRDIFTKKTTIGKLYINDTFLCNTLEDVIRPENQKVFGKTAIPSGIYKVIIDFSNHFNKELPHILNVPNFEGVRIHPGNKPEDTEGCILVGIKGDTPDWINNSVITFNKLFFILEKAYENNDPIVITIE